MSTWIKVLIGFAGGVIFSLLVIAGLLFAGFYSIRNHSLRVSEETKATRDAGAAYGRTTDNEGCITRAFDLEKQYATFDFSRMWVAECLATSRETPNFCDGVPGPLKDLNWDKLQCQKIGRDSPLCHAAYSGKQWFCEKRNK